MKRLAALFTFLFVLSCNLIAQTGSEWINFDHSYIRIPVGEDGIYRVTAADAGNIGGFLINTNIQNLQLFHRGNEQSIIVKDDGDGVFDDADYIEFYGTKNDGTLDRELYATPESQPHTHHNLFSDTTSYFLTAGSTPGKRAEVYQEPSGSLTPESHHLQQNLKLFATYFHAGKDHGDIHLTVFDQGEGWMDPHLLYNQPARQYKVSDIFEGAVGQGNPSLEIMITGTGPKQNPASVFVGPSARLVTDLVVSGFETKVVTIPLEWSDIQNDGTLDVWIKVNGDGTRIATNYLKVTYPQNVDMNNQESFIIFPRVTAGAKTLLQIANYPSNTRLFDVTDAGNFKEILGSQNSTFDAVVTSTDSERKLLATSVVKTPALKRVSFRQIDPSEHDYVIITHPSLQRPGGIYSNPVKAFAGYRASTPGGSFDTLVVNIDLLYNQFNYGEQSPLAIFHFMKYLISVKAPSYLFIVGKGLDIWYNSFRIPENYTTYKNLVPTAGYPGSDIAYTAGLNGATFGPGVPTGRISAMLPNDVAAYLNKVKETEARPFNDLRRKNVLHLSGGIYPGEPQAFRAFLEDLAPIAEGAYLGGSVEAIAKQSTDLKLVNIAEEVNKGLNLVTFFGHSSPGTLDFDVGYVTDPVMGYHNRGKYPVLLMNGCDAGAFFLNGKLFGEDWINAPEKGAIGFIAHSSYGFINPLRRYTQHFYETGFGDSVYVSRGIGDIQKRAVENYLAREGSKPVDITHVQNMVLLGDPAVPLFGARHPDYAIEDENLSIVSLDNEVITAATDSFALKFIVRNFGTAGNTPLKVKVTRTLADQSSLTYDSVYAPVYYSDTLLFVIRGQNHNYAGDNHFALMIDADEEVIELREDNNLAFVYNFIPLHSTLNLFPEKYAIVNTRDVTISFQHTDMLSSTRTFLLEIDTLGSFTSPYKQTFEIEANVMVMQQVTLLAEDSTAYFWRTRLKDPIGTESRDWNTSSFAYINGGPEGWGQLHFDQLSENDIEGLVLDSVSRRMTYEQTVIDVSVKTYGSLSGAVPGDVSVLIDGAEYNLRTQGFGCVTNTINVIAFDKNTTVPYQANAGSAGCGRHPFVINNFYPADLANGTSTDLVHYIDNVVPGDSVLIFSIGDAGYEQWPQAAKDKLGELGIAASDIDALQPGEPLIVFGRKGSAPGTASITTSSSEMPTADSITVHTTITGRFTTSRLETSWIGPAIEWRNLSANWREIETNDVIHIDIIGQQPNGQQAVLFDSLQQDQDISSIDASVYPKIKLVFKTMDDINLTAVQLKSWVVDYEPAREGLLFYKGSMIAESFVEGETWHGEYIFVNVSDQQFEQQVPVSVRIFNHDAHQATTQNILIDAPPPGDSTRFTVAVSTLGLEGANDVEVFANPRVITEQYYENNMISLPNKIQVSGEKFNPVLDVTIDGRYIQNKEYVSSTPSIKVTLWDENNYLVKTDTTGLHIFLAACEEEPCDFTRINFSMPDVSWSPATDSTHFAVIFSPTLADGTYVLRVEATDETGNPSGAEPYEISFRVNSTNDFVLSDPYPNPANDQIMFDIESSTGTIEDLTIEMIALNGSRVIKLSENDFNDIHAGYNTVTLPTSRNGSPIPAGLYLYRIRYSISGIVTERRGKIVIVR